MASACSNLVALAGSGFRLRHVRGLGAKGGCYDQDLGFTQAEHVPGGRNCQTEASAVVWHVCRRQNKSGGVHAEGDHWQSHGGLAPYLPQGACFLL